MLRPGPSSGSHQPPKINRRLNQHGIVKLYPRLVVDAGEALGADSIKISQRWNKGLSRTMGPPVELTMIIIDYLLLMALVTAILVAGYSR